MTAAEMPMTAGAAEEVLPLAGEEDALSALSVLPASLSETSVPGTSEAGASAGISAGAETSGETDEILHGGVVIDEHLHGRRRSERVDRLFRLYDRHRAGFAESVYGNHIKDLLIGIFYEENTTFFAADILEI